MMRFEKAFIGSAARSTPRSAQEPRYSFGSAWAADDAPGIVWPDACNCAPPVGETMKTPGAARGTCSSMVAKALSGNPLQYLTTLTSRKPRDREAHQPGLPRGRECMGVLSRDTAVEASLIPGPRTFPSRPFADRGEARWS
jgi:hypothetical protein